MEKFVKGIVEKLDYLYQLYENYAWKHPKANITITIQDNCIIFYLIDEDGIEDELEVDFNDKEIKLYHYLALAVLAIALGNAYVYQDENELYNSPKRRNYVRMFVNDEDILKLMTPIIKNQDKEYIRPDMKYIWNAEQDLYKFHQRKYNRAFLDEMDERIDKSKKLLRGKI